MQVTRNQKHVGATVVSAILLLGGLSGCGKSETSETLVASAKQSIQKGESKAAVIQLKNALLKNPSDIEARLTLGALYNETGDALSAEKEFRKAIELGAPADKTAFGLATALLAQQQYQKVIDETKGAATAELLVLRGHANLALAKSDEAKDSYEQALKLKPADAQALLGMARYHGTQRDLDAAKRLVAEALASHPNEPTVLMFQADLLRTEGKPDEALAAYDAVLKADPAHQSAHLAKAAIHIATGKYDAARADLAQAKKITPNSLQLFYTEALLEHSSGKNAVARELLQKVLQAAPEHLPSILLAGAVEDKLGSQQQAEIYLRKYVNSIPRDPYARKLLVSSYLKSGKLSDASSTLEPLIAAGVNPDAQSLALAGEIAMQQRDFTKAGLLFEQAAKMAPTAAGLRTSLAMSRLAQGDAARAVTDLEESTKLEPSSIRSGSLLVLAEMRLKHFDKALAAVSVMEQQHPKDPVVHNLKGGVLMAKGDTAGGRTAFEKALALNPSFFPAAANLAEVAMREKKPELAKQQFLTFLEKDPKSAEAMTALAQLAASQKQPAEVTSWLEKAQAANPDAVPPALLLGQHYAATGATDKALVLARKLQVANPDNSRVLDLLGKAQLAKGDKEGAIDSYSKLVGLMPKSAPAHLRLASAYAQVQKPGQAEETVKKALAIDPAYLDAQIVMTELLARSGKPDEAIAMTRQIQKQRAKEPIGFLLEGNLLQSQGKPALAIRPYEQALAVAPTTANLLLLHAAMSAAGKGAEAEARLVKWQKENKPDDTMRMFIAERALAKKEYKEAIAILEGVIQQAPENPAALNNLAWSYQQVKDPRALKTAEKAHSLASNAPAILDTLGYMLVEQGNAARGLGYLQKAVQLSPNDTAIRFHLAQGLAKSGDKANARKELEKVMANKAFGERDQAELLYKQL